VISRQSAAKDQNGIKSLTWTESQVWNCRLSRGDDVSNLCARGDLNRARPTLVMPELASLSVK
jgi:hypothetical protein